MGGPGLGFGYDGLAKRHLASGRTEGAIGHISRGVHRLVARQGRRRADSGQGAARGRAGLSFGRDGRLGGKAKTAASGGQPAPEPVPATHHDRRQAPRPGAAGRV